MRTRRRDGTCLVALGYRKDLQDFVLGALSVILVLPGRRRVCLSKQLVGDGGKAGLAEGASALYLRPAGDAREAEAAYSEVIVLRVLRKLLCQDTIRLVRSKKMI
jgi:hypothetical protein